MYSFLHKRLHSPLRFSTCNPYKELIRTFHIAFCKIFLQTLQASLLELCEEEKTRQVIDTRTLESLTINQKIALFKQLFKGRADVFATRWQNSKGRSGYSVACHNEWVPDICKKPNIKCSECPNRQHKALDDQAIYDHLVGKHIVGLYPLLPDNTCHLLASAVREREL